MVSPIAFPATTAVPKPVIIPTMTTSPALIINRSPIAGRASLTNSLSTDQALGLIEIERRDQSRPHPTILDNIVPKATPATPVWSTKTAMAENTAFRRFENKLIYIG